MDYLLFAALGMVFLLGAIMQLQEAKTIAQKYLELLKPLCCRCEIAGSIRREKPEVKDIEIVCIPRMVTILEFIELVNSWYKIKGEPTGKYTRRSLPEGIHLDLFIANENNWGMIFFIRTGSAEYSKSMADRWVKMGYHSKDGILFDSEGNKFYMKEEVDVYNFLQLMFVPPKYREV